MVDYASFQQIPSTILANLLTRENVMAMEIRPLWQGMPRIAGSAYTVQCAPGDNLMVHAAIYRAEPGAILVIQAGDLEYAVAGGNVCAVAQKRGIAAFIVDGVIRDVGEIRKLGFPVFARGLSPIPGGKNITHPLNMPIRCGNVNVFPGDVVVADEDGIVVVPRDRLTDLLKKAQTALAKEASESLETWEAAHRSRIEAILRDKGYVD
ncbi:MAG: RraA family protein [Anaerolineae bacterium]|nr:RraA family protein [Anaerolineae bacterium]